MPVIIKGHSGQTHEFERGYYKTEKGNSEIPPGLFDPHGIPGNAGIILTDVFYGFIDADSLLEFYNKLSGVQRENPERRITGEVVAPRFSPFAKELARIYEIVCKEVGWKDGGKNAGTG